MWQGEAEALTRAKRQEVRCMGVALVVKTETEKEKTEFKRAEKQ